MSDTHAVPPTEEERTHYYDGLLSKPLLIARTSTTPFPPAAPALTPLERENRAHPYVTVWHPGALLKRLEPIGGTSETEELHKIVRVWCPALRSELVAALDKSSLASCWSALYALRVTSTWARAPDRVQLTSAVVLFVGTDVSTASSIPRWEDGRQAALACRAVLRAWDVQDVEVEVVTSSIVGREDNSESSKEEASTSGSGNNQSSNEASTYGSGNSQSSNKVSTSGSDNSKNLEALVQFDYDTDPALAHVAVARHEDDGDSIHAFLDFPGQRLEMTLPTDDGNRPSSAWGSLGIYVGLGGPDVYALTSRHVAIGRRLPSDQRVTKDDYIPLLWGTLETLRAYAATLRQNISESQSMIEVLVRKHTRLLEETTDGAPNAEADRVETELAQRTTYANNYLPRLAATLETLAAHAPTSGSSALLPPQRMLGSAAFSAPHGRTRHGGWSDWALVQLTEERRNIVLGHKRANSVLITPHSVPTLRRLKALPILPSPYTLTGLTRDGFLPLQGPVSDVDASSSPLAVRHPRWVAKRGAKTGLTFGLIAEVEAVFRRPHADGTFVLAYALLVLDHRSGSDAFSSPGDSGSAVFDMEGRVVGLVDAGIGSGETPDPAPRALCPDITFVTPIEWIFDDIEAETGMRPVIL